MPKQAHTGGGSMFTFSGSACAPENAQRILVIDTCGVFAGHPWFYMPSLAGRSIG